MNKEQILVSPSQKFWAAISYLGILVFIPLFFKIKGEYVYFHNRQALALFFGRALFSLFAPVPVVGLLISIFGWSVCFILSLAGLVNAALGKKWEIPVFSQLSRGFKF